MSQENVETVRRAQMAWNADDLDAFLAELDPEVEWHPSIEPALPGRGNHLRDYLDEHLLATGRSGDDLALGRTGPIRSSPRGMIPART